MSIDRIGKLGKQLSLVEWAWRMGHVSDKVSQLGWTFVREVGHRREYRVDSETLGNVYCHQDSVELIEITLEAFTNVESLDENQYEDMVDGYYAKFREATKAVERELGKPAFCDGAAAPGFPEDQDAVWLALWKSPTARLMVQQKHEDRDLPFRICITVAPPKS